MNTFGNAIGTIASKFAFRVNPIDATLGRLRSVFTVDTCKEHMALFRAVGHAGTLLAGVLGLVFSAVAAIKSDSLALFLLGIGWLVGMLIIDYVSRRFDEAPDRLVASTKSCFSSTAYVDAIALIILVVSVGLFAFAIYGSIKSGDLSLFAKIGGLSVWLFYVSLIAMHAADMLNIKFRKGLKAEEEGVGLLEFNAKSWLLAVPFYFGSGLVFGVINIIWSVFSATKEGGSFASALSDSMPYFIIIAITASLPLLACVAFWLFYVLIGAMKSLIRMASVLEKQDA